MAMASDRATPMVVMMTEFRNVYLNVSWLQSLR